MTKKETIAKVAARTGLGKEDVERVYNAIFGVLKEELHEGRDARVYDFGTFKVVTRKQRVGNNPKARVQVVIPERKAVAFKVAKELKALVK